MLAQRSLQSCWLLEDPTEEVCPRISQRFVTVTAALLEIGFLWFEQLMSDRMRNLPSVPFPTSGRALLFILETSPLSNEFGKRDRKAAVNLSLSAVRAKKSALVAPLLPLVFGSEQCLGSCFWL